MTGLLQRSRKPPALFHDEQIYNCVSIFCHGESAALTNGMEKNKEEKNNFSPGIIGGECSTQHVCYNHRPWISN